MKRKKIETAGRLVRACVYASALPSESAAARQAKVKVSSDARRAMNARQSWEKLEILMAANFDPSDFVVTLTYRDDTLPKSKAAANERLKRFIRQLRAVRRARSQPTWYIYCTEGYHGDHRWHHHMILNSVGDDYDEIRSLWSVNGDNVDFDHIDLKGYEGWAIYLTKEPREEGHPRVGERTWVPSMHLIRPKPQCSICDDSTTLEAPAGAVILDQRVRKNEYGEFVYLKYLLPQRAIPLPRQLQQRA